MSTFDSAFQAVSNLVKDFKENEKYYLSQNYQEADVRNDFINKFFIALGWDVRHETQKNPYEQEVRVEKPLFIAKAQKRADYSFALAPDYRTVRFFVEAKKPSHDLTNKDYYFQIARYGWNATTPVAVLTDFEEFHIVDCRFRPSIDDALNYKLKKFHYSDYAYKEKFAEIYWLFSREAVADGSIEKYADALPKPRGKKAKAVKGLAQSIDEAFLEELDEIRNELAKSFKKNNELLSSEELTEATQRTIDRLVFIKFLEDKLIEPDHYVSNFGKRKSAWEDFITESRKLDAKYNGVVFKKTKIDELNVIEPDDKTFSAICEELSHENTPYNFDAIPIHILGSIYERFLGKVVHATDKRVTIEEKPEVRKAGGVYYTPQYIVDYIVKNTVGKLLDSKTPKQIAKMRFADIACGSGSFLITVLETLLDYHKQYYQQNPEQAKKDGCILYEGAYHLSLKQKQAILTNNIYGVDIDQQAVEVTQLSLYLKLLEDETTATANDTWVLFKEQLLPDLNKNIVCGNSLIGTDILESNLFDYEEEKRIKPMDFENVFSEVMKTGGFNAIVGNPPYILIGSDKPVEQDYLTNKYGMTSYKINTYLLFLEKGLNLLTDNSGTIGYIIPKSLIFNTYFSKARGILLKNYSLPQIVEIRNKVFDNAEVGDSILFFAEIDKNPLNNSLVYIIVNNIHPAFDIIDKYSSDQKSLLDENENKFYTDSLLLKVKTKAFSFFCDVSNGLNPGNIRHILFSDTKETNNHKKLILGKDIQRFSLTWSGTWVNYDISLKDKIKIKDTKSKKGMIAQKKVDFALRNPKIFLPNKILVRKTSDRIIGSYDHEGFYIDSLAYSIQVNENRRESILFFLALLNSKLLDHFHSSLSQNKGKVFAKVLGENLKKLPVVEIDFENLEEKKIHDKLVYLVDQMLVAKKQLQQAKTEGDKNYLNRKCERLDKEIDQLVYKLYNLTAEEIKIVEESANNSN